MVFVFLGGLELCLSVGFIRGEILEVGRVSRGRCMVCFCV